MIAVDMNFCFREQRCWLSGTSIEEIRFRWVLSDAEADLRSPLYRVLRSGALHALVPGVHEGLGKGKGHGVPLCRWCRSQPKNQTDVWQWQDEGLQGSSRQELLLPEARPTAIDGIASAAIQSIASVAIFSIITCLCVGSCWGCWDDTIQKTQQTAASRQESTRATKERMSG